MGNKLADDHDENFLMLIDRNGKWRVNTLIKGFATSVQGFASSYSNTGDIILIGKDKKEMLNAFNEIKRIGGGMVLSENGGIIPTIPLPIGGGLSAEPVEKLILQELDLKSASRSWLQIQAMQCIRSVSSINPFALYTNHANGDLRCHEKEVIVPATKIGGKMEEKIRGLLFV